MNFKTPVLFLIFNRPDTTAQVFAQIKKVQPKFLFLAADGPRIDKEGEKEKCIQAREIVMDGIDWDCEVKTLYRNENLGCGKAVSEAITWFFENVEQGIILEDDCLPDDSFFHFCEEMLEKYANDQRVFAVNGCNFNFKLDGTESYFFSRYMNVWGWATWRQSAEKIDYNMNTWQRQNKLLFLWKRLRLNFWDMDLDWYKYWKYIFNDVYQKKLDTWDYQWQYQQLVAQKVTIISSKNLIKNLGWGDEATHTKMNNHPASNLLLEKLAFPLSIPASKKINKAYEENGIKRMWHVYTRKKSLFYILNFINTRAWVQFIKLK